MMPADNLPQRPAAPNTAVDGLLQTLAEEDAALTTFATGLTDQLDALRANDSIRFEAATDATTEALHGLDRLRQARERQMRLLGRLLRVEPDGALEPLAAALDPADPARAERLRQARARLQRTALDVQARCSELEFALTVAVHLGRELLQAWRPPDGTRTYTPTGAAAPPAAALLDRVG